MHTIVRTVLIFVALLFLFRMTGKRQLAQITTFDFVLLLVVGEATQQALLGNDFSVTNSLLVIVTLLVLDVGISIMKQRSTRFEKALEGTPVLLVQNGQMFKDRMDEERVDEEDILESARSVQGLERMDQIKYAVLERNGRISIIADKANTRRPVS